MSELPQPSSVATIIVPGEADPAQVLKDGQFSVEWGGTAVREFREVTIPHVKDPNLQLPTLYLHFLHKDFCIQDGELENSLRSGNDMSEVVIKVPDQYLSTAFIERCEDAAEDVKVVVQALKSHGEMIVAASGRSGKRVSPESMFFSLKTARPKSGVSLDKKAFGIPETAEQYLFVNNHSSVIYLDEDAREAFNNCIEKLPEVGFSQAARFATFLKVFYEGGFGYNKKIPMGTGFLPVNVGTAAMSVVPAFDGQIGIGTGYPYKLPAAFLQFTETVPISIDAIRSMSDMHGRYGLGFTRGVFIWEGPFWETSKKLDFCSILPHGGFFYVPDSLRALREKGGLVYAFGESAEETQELSQA